MLHTARVLWFAYLLVGLTAYAQQLPILGLTQQEAIQRLGQPDFRYKDLQGHYVGEVYCIGGSYQSETFIQGVGWEKATKMVPLKQFTGGPCKDLKKPLSLYVRFYQGRLAMAGYMAPHGNTYDRGWITFLNRVIAGEKTLNMSFSQVNAYFRSNIVEAKGFARYANGFSTQAFFPGSDFSNLDSAASMVGVMWYGRHIRVNPDINPLTQWMVRQYVGFQ